MPSAKTMNAVKTALMDTTDDVAVPTRARSHSFASMLADMKVGDAPAAKVMLVDDDFREQHEIQQDAPLKEALSFAKERLRNNLASSISGAKRRIDGAAYSVECGSLLMDSGVYVVALVTRTE